MATLTTLQDGDTAVVAPVNSNFSALNTETRAVSVGGTGATTLTSNGVVIGKGTAALTATAAMTNGQIPIGSTGATPVAAALTAGQSILITNAAGAITIATQAGDQALFWMGA